MDDLPYFNDLFKFWNLYQFLYNSVYGLFNLNENILLNFNLNWSILEYWHFDSPLNLSNNFSDNLFFHNLFDDLRNLDYLFNNTRHNNNLFNNPFNFNNFRYFNHLLNKFINLNPNLFDSVDDSWYFYNFLLDVLEWFLNFNDMVDNFFNFHYLWFLNDQRISQINFLNDCILDALNNGLFDKFLHSNKSFMNDRYLHNLFNFSWYLFNHLNNLSDNFFNLFDFVLNDYLLSDNFDFLYSGLSVSHLNYFLYNLWHFNYSLYCLDYWNWFFDDSFYNFVLDFNMIEDFPSISVLDYWNDFLNYFLDLNNFWNLDNSFNDFLNYHRYFYYSFNNFFHRHDFLLNKFNLLILFFNVVHNPFHLDYFFNLNNFLFNPLNFYNFRNFLFNLNESFNDSWNFYNPLNSIFQRNYLLNHSIVHDGLI